MQNQALIQTSCFAVLLWNLILEFAEVRRMNWAWMLFVYVKAIAIHDHFNVEMTSCFNVVRNKQHNWGKTIRSYKIYGNRLLISPFSNTQSCKVSCLKLVTRAALITTHKVRHETRVYSSCLAQFGLFFLPEKYAVKEVDFFSHHFTTWRFSKWTLRASRRLFKVKNRVYNQKALRQKYFQILLHFNFWVREQNKSKSAIQMNTSSSPIILDQPLYIFYFTCFEVIVNSWIKQKMLYLKSPLTSLGYILSWTTTKALATTFKVDENSLKGLFNDPHCLLFRPFSK